MHDARTKREQNCFPFDTHYFGRDKFDDFDNLDNDVLKNAFWRRRPSYIFIYNHIFLWMRDGKMALGYSVEKCH